MTYNVFGGTLNLAQLNSAPKAAVGIMADKAQVKTSLNTPSQLSSFLAASSPQRGDWLHAMPISSCGLRLDDEAVRIGIGLRLGLTLCVPHNVTADLWSMLRDCMDSFAGRLQEDRQGTTP